MSFPLVFHRSCRRYAFHPFGRQRRGVSVWRVNATRHEGASWSLSRNTDGPGGYMGRAVSVSVDLTLSQAHSGHRRRRRP